MDRGRRLSGRIFGAVFQASKAFSGKQGVKMMIRGSILAAAAMALCFAMPASLRADDPSPFGPGSSPFGKALDDQKIRNDMAKLRYQIDHQNDWLRQGNTANSQQQGRGTARSRSTSQKRFSEQNRDLRDWQRDQLKRQSNKRSSGRSSSRGSSGTTPAS
jgi:hypothetical protein